MFIRRHHSRLIFLLAVFFVLFVSNLAKAECLIFSDSFDDGDWTHNPKWEFSIEGPITVSNERSVSPPYSLNVSTNNQPGAIYAYSCLTSATQSFSCTFNLYIESMGDEAIPWCLRSTSGGVAAIIFILPGGTVQLFVLDSTSGWSGKASNVPFPLTYGAWHSFRITYDGSITNLYLDGHTEPDASVAQTYVYVPSRVSIGNISLPHTSTFYVDDLAFYTSTQYEPGRVYVQICSDTSTGGINVSNHYNNFPADDYTYTSPEGQGAQVMAESYREGLRDSLGNPIKFTWYMNLGSLYSCGVSTGPLLPLDLMVDNHGDSIERWGDELAYHYHTWIWSDPDGDSVYHWNQAPDFTYCVDDFETTVAHMILDRMFYPSSFRSGWHGMDNFFQSYLDDWFPYRFENAWPAYREDPTEPVDNVYDWRRAPSEWVPYHPDANDYQVPGNLRGWESRCAYMNSITASEVENIFLKALAGTSQIVTAFSHLKEADFPAQVVNLHARLTDAADKIPCVKFEYLTGRECMMKWRNGTDVTPPTIQYSVSDSGGVRTVTFSTDEEIYQVQPFVARKGSDGTYARMDSVPVGINQWRIQYNLLDTVAIAVGVTDWFGNPRVRFFPVPLRIGDTRVSTTTNSAEVTWTTNNPADSKVEYQLASSGGTTSVYSSKKVLKHRVVLTGLMPGSVYKISISSEDEFGELVEVKDIYVLTKLSGAVVIDNVDAGFSTVGSWSTGSTAPGKYGSDYCYAMTSPTGTSSAYWTWQVAETGIYRICAWWSEGTNRSTTARYSVIYGGTEEEKIVNQQTDGGKWNSLGIYYLEAGNTVQVKLSNKAPSGYVVIADAVKFEQAYTSISNIGLARRLEDGNSIRISNVAVTAVFDSAFYIEEIGRSAGLKVEGSGVSVGDIVQVSGELATIGGERTIINPLVEKMEGSAFLKPLAITARDINLGACEGVTTAGLLVTVWGKVSSVGVDYFYVDDGSSLEDGSSNVGLRIDASILSSPPQISDFAMVTGVVGAQDLDVGTVPIIRPRSSGEIIFY
ncbi:MAG: hypothetical protein K6T99_03390 [Armatimonadetes bacterium]|nr:hypothetical protein [Armatimonadota bacterium]